MGCSGTCVRDETSVVGLAVRLTELAAEQEQILTRLAEIVRDGGDDARPGDSARELMVAAGQLHHTAQITGVLGLIQIDVTNAYLDDAMGSAARWAERHAGLSVATVRELNAVGRSLARYPVLASAFLEGRIRSGELAAVDRIIPARFHGSALTDAVAFLTDVQQELLDGIEASLGPKELGRFLARVRDRLDTDGPEPRVIAAEDSEVRLTQRTDKRWDLTGDLSESDGGAWKTFLTDRDQRNLRNRTKDPDRPGTRDGRPVPVRDAEAMTQLLLDGAGAHKPGRVGLFLRVELDDLLTKGADVPLIAKTEANHDITDDTFWAWMAGADVTPIFTHNGTPLSYGRTRRLAPDILKHALAFRDCDCFLPGCDVTPNRLDSHHLTWWEHGGTTDPTNNWGACSCHHHCIHDRGWQIAPDPNGKPGDTIVLKPDGTSFDPTPIWRTRRHKPDLDLARQRLRTLHDEYPPTG